MFKDKALALGRKILKIEPEWEVAARLLLVWFCGRGAALESSSYI